MIEDETQLSPADGILAINHSLRCFGYGLASLLPLIGLPLAGVSFVNFLKAQDIVKGRWNPARAYLMWGSVLGSLGLLISLLIILFFIGAWLQLLPWQYGQG